MVLRAAKETRVTPDPWVWSVCLVNVVSPVCPARRASAVLSDPWVPKARPANRASAVCKELWVLLVLLASRPSAATLDRPVPSVRPVPWV